jgi:hypothetical protein
MRCNIPVQNVGVCGDVGYSLLVRAVRRNSTLNKFEIHKLGPTLFSMRTFHPPEYFKVSTSQV